jgi:hypothetical protein
MSKEATHDDLQSLDDLGKLEPKRSNQQNKITKK